MNRILILDDQISFFQQTIEFLQGEEFKVLTAYDSQSVFKCFESDDQPDVCFFDVDLKHTEKHINGLDIAQKLKTAHPKMPIVIFTNWSDEALYYQRAKDLGLEFVDRNLMSNKVWLIDKIASLMPTKPDLIAKNDGRLVFFDEPTQTYHCVKNTEIVCIRSAKVSPKDGKPYSGTEIHFEGNRHVVFGKAIGDVLENLKNAQVDISHLEVISDSNKRLCLAIAVNRISRIDSDGYNYSIWLNSGEEFRVSGADKNRILEYYKRIVQNNRAD